MSRSSEQDQQQQQLQQSQQYQSSAGSFENQQQRDNNNDSNSNSSASDNKRKRNPQCSRCRGHGMEAQVKGHKRHCEYKDCECDGCRLVQMRQLVSAAQIKRRRYQKQDEECGRKIEISPPVLARDRAGQPSALAASLTLIGQHSPSSNSSNPAQSQKSPSKQQQQFVAANHRAYQFDYHAAGLPPTPGLPSTHHHHLSQAQHLSAASQSLVLPGPVVDQLVGTVNNIPSHHQPSTSHRHNNHHQHLLRPSSPPYQHHHHHHHHQPATTGAIDAIGAPAALNNALQLLQYPNSVISAAAAASLSAASHSTTQTSNNRRCSPPGGLVASSYNHHNHHLLSSQRSTSPTAAAAAAAAAAAVAVTAQQVLAKLPAGPRQTSSLASRASSLGADFSPSAGASPAAGQQLLPAPKDQINLVEEIYDSCGPLAVYAWFRAEQFDMQKIRDTIELSRAPFDELLQITGHSPLDLTSPIVDV